MMMFQRAERAQKIARINCAPKLITKYCRESETMQYSVQARITKYIKLFMKVLFVHACLFLE